MSRSLVVEAETVVDDVETGELFSIVDITISEESSSVSNIMDDCNVGQEVAGGTWF